jgi:hypothetical protein
MGNLAPYFIGANRTMSSLSAPAMAMLVGMNFSFLDPQMHGADACAKDPSINFRGAMFLPKYSDPLIRERVKDELGQLRQSGFSSIRTLVAFADRPSRFSDWFDSGLSTQDAPRLVAEYVSDVTAAGFNHLELAFSSQAGANPACRKERWGDCFNNATIAQNIAFVTAVRRGLAPPPGIELRFDLANEACIVPEMARPLAENYQSYIRPLVAEYRHQFPRDNVTVSCSIGRLAEARPRLDETFAAAGSGPSFYEIHAYENSTIDINAIALNLKHALGNSSAPLVIGETNFGLPSYTNRLLSALEAVDVRVESILFWPLKNSANDCGVDVPPPYTRSGALGSTPIPQTKE